MILANVRQAMVAAGRSGKLMNKDVNRGWGMFGCAVEHQLLPVNVHQVLSRVKGLRQGPSDAKETVLVEPVPEGSIRAILPHLSPQMAAMVRLLTAARPGEVCAIRPRDIDRTGPAWIYRPESHKTEHHGRERVVGPRAQEVLAPWLERDPDDHCFCPAEVVAERGAPSRGHAARPKPGGKYTRHSYRVAIALACDRAFPHPAIVKKRGVALTGDQAAELAAWRKAHRWHPHQLRHTRATEIRKRFDVEAAQVILGHSKPDTTLMYAERNLAKAREVMWEIG